MNSAIEHLQKAQAKGMAERPKVGGFPYFAEILRRAGISRNIVSLPSCQSIFLGEMEPVVVQGTPLLVGAAEIPGFDRDAVISALRADQAGETTFLEFLNASWKAGIVRFEVDFKARKVAYFGCLGEDYVEDYPAVEVAK